MLDLVSIAKSAFKIFDYFKQVQSMLRSVVLDGCLIVRNKMPKVQVSVVKMTV
jgi:hypothetical protein